MMNKRPQNKHTPYSLVINGKLHGNYSTQEIAKRVALGCEEANLRPVHYQIRLNDNVVDSND